MYSKLQSASKFVKKWYLRYLVATELYMVEPWEKVFIHIVLLIFFGLFWYFNYSIVLNGVLQLRDSRRHAETF